VGQLGAEDAAGLRGYRERTADRAENGLQDRVRDMVRSQVLVIMSW
jgi:hypothetical protein